MSRSPWPGYTARPIANLDDFLAVHRHLLKGLRGKRITQFWFPWHEEWDMRWADGPMVVDFQGTHMEFEGLKCMISVCWNTLDLNQPPGDGLTWVNEPPGFQLSELVGQPLADVRLLSFGAGDEVVGLEFQLANKAIFSLWDNGDETGFTVGAMSRQWMFPVAFS